jgi:cystathionine beta-lyase family protein involved in aluminum resistance
MAVSLLKIPEVQLSMVGGYIAGKAELVEMACYRLTAPGIGSEGRATFDQNRLLYQGLFLAPQMVGEAMKGSHLIAYVGDKLGLSVNPCSFLCLDATLFKRLNSVPPIS